jgi:NADH-quinone oxidoreductase subunit G
MISININDKNYAVPENTTVFKACEKAGINIPSLCYDERLEPGSSCKLCVVEVDGQNDLMTSCSLKVEQGMRVQTHSDKVVSARREVLDSLLLKHPQAINYSAMNHNRFQSYCNEYGVANKTNEVESKRYPIDYSNPFYYIDPNKCIACNRCIRVCNELQGRSSLELNENGFVSSKPVSADTHSVSFECESCGNCISACPTGAIVSRPYLEEIADMMEFEGREAKEIMEEEARNVKTTCSYCGVGCQLELVVKNGHVVDSKPVNVDPNNGLLCVKGRFGYRFINHPDRLKTPLIRKDGKLVEATWEEAYSLITEKATEIKSKHGGKVFGGLSSARCTNEENYLFQKLIRGVFGTNNVDHCARL